MWDLISLSLKHWSAREVPQICSLKLHMNCSVVAAIKKPGCMTPNLMKYDHNSHHTFNAPTFKTSVVSLTP